MSDKHTPGPWASSPTAGNHDTAIYSETDGTGRDLALVRDASEGEGQANARVMTAGPEMLAALKRATPWLGKLIAEGVHKECVAPLDAENTLKQIEALIAKVEEPTP